MDIIKKISVEMNIQEWRVKAAVDLLDAGNTVPFIARYRKEVTGTLDDSQLRDLSDRLEYLRNLDKRRDEILKSIEEQGALTDELKEKILAAEILSTLEDLYLPYKKKKKTRASVAKEKGLEPLATLIFEQNTLQDVKVLAKDYINPELGVNDVEEALSGANDIIAEWVSENAEVRSALRILISDNAFIHSTSKETEPGVYSMYYDFSEPIKKIASYRVLAIDRGEKEEVLKVNIECDQELLLNKIYSLVVSKNKNSSVDFVKTAVQDSLSRLIYPSLEREARNNLTESADEQAISVFALNLKPLLMQPPIHQKVAMGFDPAYRTGCKIAIVDETGKVLDTTVVYPTPPQNKIEEAKEKLLNLIDKYKIDIIAIGNGTASKESEIFVSDLIKEASRKVSYMVVSEAGASVYSASKLGAEEFPQFDVSLRSAVSIARRLQDPLAELVKIEPKAIGVGQYQHDMPPARLNQTLGGVVEDCVNSVGVDVNTASVSLLSYVAGIGPALAKNIVLYREENGSFEDRDSLEKVPKLGKKAYTQCAGFLRVINGKNPLDNTSVHPESYPAVKKLFKILNFKMGQDVNELEGKIKEYGIDKICKEIDIGEITLNDIIKELKKPGRDPRDELPPPMLRSDLLSISDLKPEMKLKGTVRNVVDFGAFIDIGVHQDGLVHISRITDKFIKHPSEVLRVGDVVDVKVLEIDEKRKRISLTMRDL